MKVQRWADALAIRLPGEIIKMLDLEEGDGLKIRVIGPDTLEIERTQGGQGGVVRSSKADPRRERHV